VRAGYGTVVTSHGPATREAFSIDGGRVGVIAWPPDKLQVAGSFKRGEHTLEIAVAGNLRNMLGPHCAWMVGWSVPGGPKFA